jgi:inosine/xanthosine triphosphate pyrophosphatase family protein
MVDDMGKTMAELSMAEKNQLSHRARAVRSLWPDLEARLRSFQNL